MILAPRTFIGVLAALLAGAAAPARGQQCDTVTSRTSLAALSGRPIRSVRIVTRSPAPFPKAARALEHLHVRTRESTIRRQLTVSRRDTVDTLAVAESLRRLRRLRYLADASVDGVSCGSDSLDIIVTTMDGWSTKPSVKVHASGAALELTERNVLGTGREARLALRSDLGRIGIGAALRDPSVLGRRVALDIANDSYRDGNAWSVAIGRQEASVFDRWGMDASARSSTRDPAAPVVIPGGATAAGAFRRVQTAGLITRRLTASDVAVVAGLAGIGYERAGLAAAPHDQLIGPDRVRRSFAGFDVGVLRRSVAYDTVTWMLPGEALVDIPLAFEADLLVSAGRERILDVAAGHLDLWMGRIWLPGPGSLTVADLWASGYRMERNWTAGTVRAAVEHYRAAPRGLWTARLAVEHLSRPDPDLRALASVDPTASALPQCARLAESAASVSVERSVHLRRLSGSWTVDGAVFSAASGRWDPPEQLSRCGSRPSAVQVEALYAGVLGLGLRMTPRKAGRATARLDIGLVTVGSGDVRRRPFVALAISPSLEQNRRRDGRGTR